MGAKSSWGFAEYDKLTNKKYEDGKIVDVVGLYDSYFVTSAGSKAEAEKLIRDTYLKVEEALKRSNIDVTLRVIHIEQVEKPCDSAAAELRTEKDCIAPLLMGIIIYNPDIGAYFRGIPGHDDNSGWFYYTVGPYSNSITKDSFVGGGMVVLNLQGNDLTDPTTWAYSAGMQGIFQILAHEIGHAFGAFEDLFHTINGILLPPTGYNHYYNFTDNSKQNCYSTLVNYNRGCPANEWAIQIDIPYYSNPDVMFLAEDGNYYPTGDDTHNEAKVMNAAKVEVSSAAYACDTIVTYPGGKLRIPFLKVGDLFYSVILQGDTSTFSNFKNFKLIEVERITDPSWGACAAVEPIINPENNTISLDIPNIKIILDETVAGKYSMCQWIGNGGYCGLGTLPLEKGRLTAGSDLSFSLEFTINHNISNLSIEKWAVQSW